MTANLWRLHWLFNRRVGLTLLWTALLLIGAIIVNLIGLRLAGGIDAWAGWMHEHAGHFLTWRLLLYATTVWAWRWMRRRVLTREPDRAAAHRLRRAEFAGVVAMVALEASQLVQAG